MKTKKYTCPCCGYVVFSGPPGTFEQCPICFWEDELFQLRYPQEIGANMVSLVDAQINFEKYGVSDLDLKLFIRKPGGNDKRDKNWRKLDLKKDKIATKKESGLNNVNIYPMDTTKLYYWEDNFLVEEL